MKNRSTAWMIATFAVILFAWLVVEPLFGFSWYLIVLGTWIAARILVTSYQFYLLRRTSD